MSHHFIPKKCNKNKNTIESKWSAKGEKVYKENN